MIIIYFVKFILYLVPIPRYVRDLLSCTCGSVVLWQVFGAKSVHLAGQLLAGCFSVALTNVLANAKLFPLHNGAWIVTLICVSYLVVW